MSSLPTSAAGPLATPVKVPDAMVSDPAAEGVGTANLTNAEEVTLEATAAPDDAVVGATSPGAAPAASPSMKPSPPTDAPPVSVL